MVYYCNIIRKTHKAKEKEIIFRQPENKYYKGFAFILEQAKNKAVLLTFTQ